MSMIPSVRSIREGLRELAQQAAPDAVALATFLHELEACARGVRASIDRAVDFAGRGLASEALSVIEDYPNLVREAESLRTLASDDASGEFSGELSGDFSRDSSIGRFWAAEVAEHAARLPMPTAAEVESLAGIALRAEGQRALVDALRLSALRREPIAERLRILRRIRAADSRNRMWLEQIEVLESAWLREIASLRVRAGATLAELEQAISALDSNPWVAGVPRGLRDELTARAAPLRAAAAGERFARLADEIHDAAARMDREALVRLEAEWAAINLETGCMPGEVLAASVAPAFAWLGELERESAARAAFDAEVDRLERLLAEARPAVEIERQVAVLRDAGREAPRGLMDRAVAVVGAERERTRRRHGILLVGAIAGACALAVVGTLLVRSVGESRRAAQELAALDAAIETNDAAKARGIAEGIRARGDAVDAALAASLAKEDALHRARLARTAEIRGLAEDLAAELERGAARARVDAMKALIADARQDAEEPERIALDGLERRRTGRLAELDAEAERASLAAVARADAILKDTKLPDLWTDAAQVDPGAWKTALAALESARGALDAVRAESEGLETARARLLLKREAIDARITEARSRAEALELALRDLDPARLCAPVTLEADFVRRLSDALSRHGAVLARQGRLASFEAAREFAPAWEAIEAWRDEHRPRLAALLGAGLSGDASPDQQPRVVEVVNDFLAKHPASPLGESLRAIAARFDPTRAGDLWAPSRVGEELAAVRLAGLEEVPLTGGRIFYRRPAEGADPRNQAVENLADLLTPPERLDSILWVKREDLAGAPRLNEVSKAWGEAVARLEGAGAAEVRTALVELLSAIRAAKSEPLLRLRALHDAASIFERSGYLPQALAQPFLSWRESLRAGASRALVADWPRAGHEPEVNFRDARAEAVAALARFPDLSVVLAESRAEQERAASVLKPLAPVGVLAPADGAAPREVVGTRESGRFVAVVRAGTGWAFAEIALRDGVLDERADPRGQALPKGPILIFRRLPS
jgi:hypothetical protein